jgi:hypothetical protein
MYEFVIVYFSPRRKRIALYDLLKKKPPVKPEWKGLPGQLKFKRQSDRMSVLVARKAAEGDSSRLKNEE